MPRIVKQTATLSLSSIALFWVSCSSTVTSPQSYINEVIEPEHLSPVYECTDIMLQAIRNQSVTPPPATRAFAMAHLSGFLAVNGIEQKYSSKYGVQAALENTHQEVAYLVAFTESLSDALNASFVFDQRRMLARYTDDEAKANGIRYGKYVASVIIADRINDGAEPNQANFYLDHYEKRTDRLAWSPLVPFTGLSGDRVSALLIAAYSQDGELKKVGSWRIKPSFGLSRSLILTAKNLQTSTKKSWPSGEAKAALEPLTRRRLHFSGKMGPAGSHHQVTGKS